jgi:hypothetical protein
VTARRREYGSLPFGIRVALWAVAFLVAVFVALLLGGALGFVLLTIRYP